MLIPLTALLVFALPAGRSQSGSDVPLEPAEAAARAEAYVNAIDTPIREDQWQHLGPAGAARLEEIALDEKRLPSRRARAVEALALVGKDSAAGTLARLARGPNEPFVVRLSAIRSLPRAAPERSVLETLQPVLEGAPGDVRIRAAAAETLAQSLPTSGCPLVEAQWGREAAVDQTHFRKALRLCKRDQR
jgi:hypothetical protein